MDTITFRFLISLAVLEELDMRLMHVITTYLYGSMDNDIYMKIPERFKLPEANNTKSRSMYSIKLQRSLYGLKQSGRMWPDENADLMKSPHQQYESTLTSAFRLSFLRIFWNKLVQPS